ncbi:MAG: hypothetical protein J6B75_11050 [Ruminococcus sp.]|nr:hypothetical protein [Ruminococcus sp.]MBO5164953.1 hypothetical protein [Ruminococcus sp.]
MKKLLTSVVICVCLFVMTACSSPMNNSTKRENNLNSSFTAKMTVVLDKLTAEGTITRSSDSIWEAEFESPNTLSGVKLCFEGNTVNASYKGLSFSVPKSALPVKAMLTNLISAVDAAAREEQLQGTESEGLLNISGTLESGDYTLSIDDKGCIHSFEMPNNLLKIVFTEVTVSGTPQIPQSSELTTVCTTSETACTEAANTETTSTAE